MSEMKQSEGHCCRKYHFVDDLTKTAKKWRYCKISWYMLKDSNVELMLRNEGNDELLRGKKSGGNSG